MLEVKVIRLLEESEEKVEPLVVIKVVMNLPQLQADPKIGLSMVTAPPVTIAKDTVTFSEMKTIMDIYNFKKWDEVKSFLAEKYLNYFRQVMKETL